ncbi:MAG: LacI family DNA-binding transcriptional regulator [Planctomycetota bacterium]|jgi:LacI family transcriptional regulator
MYNKSKSKAPTLKSIGKEAGICPATVSRILNDKGKEIKISDKMIAKVKGIAAKVGYTPHSQARNLKFGISNIIGVAITAGNQSELIYRLFKGISEAAMDHGKSLLFFDTTSVDDNINALKKCIEARVDGIITMQKAGRKHTRFLNKLLDDGVKIVTVLGNEKECRCPRVDIDHAKGAEIAIDALLKKGHRRIAYIGNANKNSVAWERHIGYKRALSKHGLYDAALCKNSGIDPHKAFSVMKNLMKATPPPSAVFAWNDKSAISAQKAILEAGEKIEIIGFDDKDFIKYLEYPFPSVHSPLREVGRRAIEIILNINASKETVITPYLKI